MASAFPLKVRSMVGLIPLFAVETLDPERGRQAAGLQAPLQWFIENRPELSEHIEAASHRRWRRAAFYRWSTGTG